MTSGDPPGASSAIRPATCSRCSPRRLRSACRASARSAACRFLAFALFPLLALDPRERRLHAPEADTRRRKLTRQELGVRLRPDIPHAVGVRRLLVALGLAVLSEK